MHSISFSRLNALANFSSICVNIFVKINRLEIEDIVIKRSQPALNYTHTHRIHTNRKFHSEHTNAMMIMMRMDDVDDEQLFLFRSLSRFRYMNIWRSMLRGYNKPTCSDRRAAVSAWSLATLLKRCSLSSSRWSFWALWQRTRSSAWSTVDRQPTARQNSWADTLAKLCMLCPQWNCTRCDRPWWWVLVSFVCWVQYGDVCESGCVVFSRGGVVWGYFWGVYNMFNGNG